MIFSKTQISLKKLAPTAFFVLAIAGLFVFARQKNRDDRFVSCIVDPQKQELKFYWKDEKGANFKSLGRLKSWLDNDQKTLVFAMNAGMFRQDRAPQGLFIENFTEKTPLDTASGLGNFYLKPNGIFYLTAENFPKICTTPDFFESKNVKFATQSGPMLVVNGEIHPAFKKGSTNLNIRNGVGIFSDNQVVFAMSKTEVNFYDFAEFFKTMGCKNALYLDGFVSRTYFPEGNWVQADGDFGAIIGVTTDKH